MRKVFIVAAMAFLAMGAQAQNLVKNGNFDTPLNNEKTYASIPSTAKLPFRIVTCFA